MDLRVDMAETLHFASQYCAVSAADVVVRIAAWFWGNYGVVANVAVGAGAVIEVCIDAVVARCLSKGIWAFGAYPGCAVALGFDHLVDKAAA